MIYLTTRSRVRQAAFHNAHALFLIALMFAVGLIGTFVAGVLAVF